MAAILPPPKPPEGTRLSVVTPTPSLPCEVVAGVVGTLLCCVGVVSQVGLDVAVVDWDGSVCFVVVSGISVGVGVVWVTVTNNKYNKH